MNRRLLPAIAWICVAHAFCGGVAHADLGNCFVLRGHSEQLDGDAYHECVTSIIEAWEDSDVMDMDFVFLLNIDSTIRNAAYRIRPINLGWSHEPRPIRDPWPGYMISAPDIEGLRFGVAEVVKAFEAGVIHRLKHDDRDGQVDSPLLREK
jgi:hypothetical protein